MQRFNIEREKLVNAVLFFAKKLNHPNKTNIFKALFNSDFRHIRRVGRPIFGLKYYAWKYGPVPKDLYDEINGERSLTGCEDCLAIIEETNDDGYGHKEFIFKSKKKPNMEYFSDIETEILDEIALIYKYATATISSKITHEENTPWYLTYYKKGPGVLIDNSLAFEEEDSQELDRETALDRLKRWEWFANQFSVDIVSL